MTLVEDRCQEENTHQNNLLNKKEAIQEFQEKDSEENY